MRLAACLACSAISSAETGKAGALLQGPQVTVFSLPSFFSIVVRSSWHWAARKEPACDDWGTGAPREAGGLPWQALPPELLWQIQSGYSLEQPRCHKGMGAKGG